MPGTVEIPDKVLQELEAMARREGASIPDLIRRLVEAHIASSQPVLQRGFDVTLPMIPAAETGPIHPVTGADMDELFSRDDFTS